MEDVYGIIFAQLNEEEKKKLSDKKFSNELRFTNAKRFFPLNG